MPERGAQRQRGRPPRRAVAGPGTATEVDQVALSRAVDPGRLERTRSRLDEAARAYRRGRYEEARALLRTLAQQAPTAEAVRELLGLTLYRLGRWREAQRELEAFRDLSGSVEQNPVLADVCRALGAHGRVEELWAELGAASPGAELVAEGRIVMAGSLADRGRLAEAIALLEAAPRPSGPPRDHQLRTLYALADLHERAGDVPRARALFRSVADHDPDLGGVAERLRNLR